MNNISKNSFRTAFQNSIKDIETSIAEYKTSFPKNFGDMFRSKISLICFTFAGYCVLSAIAFTSTANLMMAFFVSLPMFFAAILLSYKSKEVSPDQVNNLRKTLISMENFPDVKKYAEEIDEELERVEKKKKSYKIVMNVIYWLYVAILSGLLIHSFVTDNTFLRDDLENIHREDNCGDFSKAAEFFNLEPKTPFAVIKPFDSEQTPSDIQLFLVNINPGKGTQAGDCLVAFRFAAPNIKNSQPGDKYTITVTDKQGNPSEVSFKFTVGDNLVQNRVSFREPEALNICNYVYNHAKELRYKVEILTN